MKKLQEVLDNKKVNHLYPFFWQHGESDQKITEYMKKIKEEGIYALCIESRPHPDFLEEGWWKSMDHIISEAKRLQMPLWILDDARFPTGYANGKVPEELKKVYLTYHRFDFVGPKRYAEVNTKYMPGFRALMNEDHSKDIIVKAIMVKNDTSKQHGFDETSMIDVTDKLVDGYLHVDIPTGNYSIYVLYYTREGGEEVTKDYLNPMVKEGTEILLREVYQKHYDHYQDEFGKIIEGFFSDEPRFGNTNRASSIGREEMPLPWMPNMLEVMHERIPDFDENKLVFLFHGTSDEANRMRYEYMNLISKLYSENFSLVIGDWCREHGVEYVGHIIEDNNADSRLGKGAGHFFRGLAGQDIAGIDVIGGQLVPGMPYHHDAYLTGGSQGEFYHYALCKLGASSAKLDSNKNGTLMCEAFGAYGWVEGLKLMKWITDHMISHGVNLIVPHAFDPKEFPDWDCPPHFYAHGNNPQYPYFHNWANYANRLCNLFSGGYQVCNVGILYHAFAEWSGDYMFVQTVLKELLTNQIDCNVISEDYLETCRVKDNKFYIKEYGYDVIIVPYAKKLPKSVLTNLIHLATNGVKVIYTNAYPTAFNNEVDSVAIQANSTCLPIDTISKELKTSSLHEVTTSSNEDQLTYYHYHHNDGEAYMFFNEGVLKDIDTVVTLNTKEDVMIYDAYTNETYALPYQRNENQIVFDLVLKPYESLVLVAGTSTNTKYTLGEVIKGLNTYEVSFKAFNENTFGNHTMIENLEYLGKQYMNFSGTMRYTTEVEIEDTNIVLNIEDVYETVNVKVNGQDCGTRICPSYIFDISKALIVGKNKLEIDVVNTLNRNQRDMMSMYMETDPLGIVGKVEVYKKVLEPMEKI